jgi:hypothetical protein
MAFRGDPAKVSSAPRGGILERDDVESMKRANENLTESLHECDRRLALLHAGAHPGGSSGEDPIVDERDAGVRVARRNGNLEPSKADWERMAEVGQLRVRIPCIREAPWQPPQRAVDRLGLAPRDAEVLKEAYAASNRRMTDQIKPICAKVLGTAEAAEKVGPVACMDTIASVARRSNPEGMKQSLGRAAEVQSGKRSPPRQGDDVAPIEQLALVLAGEQPSFERDLAEKLGPEDAKRIAWSPDLCTERRTLRATDDDALDRRVRR